MKSRNQSLVRSRLLLIGGLVVLVVLAGIWVFGPGAVRPLPPTPTLAPPPNVTFTPPPDLHQLATEFPRLGKILDNPELDSVYKDFLLAYERGGIDAAELLARQRELLTADDQVRVTLVLDTENTAPLVKELEALGVNVRGTYRELIDISIPLDLIVQTAQLDNPGQVFDQITQLDHVIGLELPKVRPPNQTSRSPARIDPVGSEGVKFIRADGWQAAGYTGRGVKIGVLDQGFDGYRDLLGRELPASVQVESFVPGIPADQTGVTHGAAVAEIIHDVAPDAELYLAYYDGGDVSMGNAVDWLVSQGVNIISHSAGGMAAPMDGTGRDAELVDRTVAQGILWINSVGNSAREHYRGLYTDTNGDGVHEFAPDKTLLGFQASPDLGTQIVLDWNDWAVTGTQDLDLYLLDVDGNVLASSRNSRDGGHPPVEQIVYKFDDSRTYYVTIQGVHVTQPVRIDLYVHETPNMELTDPAGSLATPSDATGSLTVGAVYWRDSQLEPFSSHGPTTDNRIKPDLVGPDGVSNAIYAPDRFYGTSAAAPHITGAAALVWSAYPDSTGQEIKDFLMANTVDLLEPGPDPETGAGVLELPAPPPQPTPLPPTSTPAPGETPASPLATPTPRKIVIIASPAAPLPRPPVATPPNGNGNLIGLGALAIVLGIIGWAGLRMALHARGEASPQPHGFRAEITRKATGQSRSSSSAMQAACAYCGRAQSADAVFCTQCGRPFGAAITLTKCPRCARALRPGARYCTHCGQPAA